MAIVIRAFASKPTERIFHRKPVRKFPPDMWRAAQRKLLLLDAAEQLDDLLVPHGSRLEKLAGDRMGQHSIRINDQWRICFYWNKRDAYAVEIVDYH